MDVDCTGTLPLSTPFGVPLFWTPPLLQLLPFWGPHCLNPTPFAGVALLGSPLPGPRPSCSCCPLGACPSSPPKRSKLPLRITGRCSPLLNHASSCRYRGTAVLRYRLLGGAPCETPRHGEGQESRLPAQPSRGRGPFLDTPCPGVFTLALHTVGGALKGWVDGSVCTIIGVIVELHLTAAQGRSFTVPAISCLWFAKWTRVKLGFQVVGSTPLYKCSLCGWSRP